MCFHLKCANEICQVELTNAVKAAVESYYSLEKNAQVLDDFFNYQEISRDILKNLDNTFVFYHDNEIVGICSWNKNLIEYFIFNFKTSQKSQACRFLNDMIAMKTSQYFEIKCECLEQFLLGNEFFKSCGFTLANNFCDDETCYNIWKYHPIDHAVN